jgi:hypothetical protein
MESSSLVGDVPGADNQSDSMRGAAAPTGGMRRNPPAREMLGRRGDWLFGLARTGGFHKQPLAERGDLGSVGGPRRCD